MIDPEHLLLLLAAPFAGSFVGTLALRSIAPRSIALGRSACPACDHPLGARDLVPLASWLALGGRCRYCDQPIGWFYPAIELAAAGLAVWSVLAPPDGLVVASALFGWCLLALAVSDLRYFLLPDFLTLPLIPAGLLVAYCEQPDGLASRLLGAAAGFGAFAVARAAYRALRGREGLGLGDVKLLAAAGAWVGWEGLPSVVLIAALAGLVLAALQRRAGVPLALDGRVAFGAGLCAATWLVWIHGPLATS